MTFDLNSPTHGDAIIIGIDFGTTYSGVAWCYTGDPERIRVIKNWPGNNKNLEKVETLLSYSVRNTERYKWGFEVQQDSSTPIAWFKLLLNDQKQSSSFGKQLSNQIGYDVDDVQLKQLQDTFATIPSGKEPVDLVEDYLKALQQHTLSVIKKAYPKAFVDQLDIGTPIKYCLTVPAVWSDKAKNLTLKAAHAAGMGKNGSRIRLVTEPEAAAIHCLKSFQETENCLKVGNIYVVADCGGGTVDLISYKVTNTKPHLEVKECAVGTGGFCGSTSLNRRFEQLVKKRIGSTYYTGMTAQARNVTLNHFDQFLKPTFLPTTDSNIDEDFEVEIFYCPVPGLQNDSNKGIQGGFLVLTSDELQTIFQPTFNEIQKLVQAQVTASESRNTDSVTGILLVGGFGSSEYLRQHLESNIQSKSGGITILQPNDAWTAIVRGAVIDGTVAHESEKLSAIRSRGMVQSRIARFSYGTECSMLFIPGIHPNSHKFYWEHYGEFYCRNRMSWFIKKGEEIPDHIPIRSDFYRTNSIGTPTSEYIYAETIYCCDLDGPPDDSENTNVIPLCIYKADFSDKNLNLGNHLAKKRTPKTQKEFLELNYQMALRYKSVLEFSTELGGKTAGKQTVEYNHQTPKENAFGNASFGGR